MKRTLDMTPLLNLIEERRASLFGVRRWLFIPPFSVFMRVTSHYLDGAMQPTLDVATIDNAEQPGQGAFSVFMTEVEKIALKEGCYVRVESVNNEDLVKHLAKRGYQIKDEDTSPIAFKSVEALNRQYNADENNPDIC